MVESMMCPTEDGGGRNIEHGHTPQQDRGVPSPDHIEQACIKQGLGSHQEVCDCGAWFGEWHGDYGNLDNAATGERFTGYGFDSLKVVVFSQKFSREVLCVEVLQQLQIMFLQE